MTTPEKIAVARRYLESIFDTDGSLKASPAPNAYKHRGPGFHNAWMHAETFRDDAQTIKDFLLHASECFRLRGEPGRQQGAIDMALTLGV